MKKDDNKLVRFIKEFDELDKAHRVSSSVKKDVNATFFDDYDRVDNEDLSVSWPNDWPNHGLPVPKVQVEEDAVGELNSRKKALSYSNDV